MRILLTGATGFIGRRLASALAQAGHEVVCAVRQLPPTKPPKISYVLIDFNHARQPADWANAVAGIDVVVNAVGILRESPGRSFDAVHRSAPVALFMAATEAGAKHIVQLSALGADDQARSAYHLSKKAADDVLMSLPVRATVVQPSLVYGPGGASAALFELFASMPVVPLPAGGRQQIQPVHIDDLIQAILVLIESPEGPSERIAMVGPHAITLQDFYAGLRRAMGFRRHAWFISVPQAVMAWVARIGKWLPGGFLDSDTLSMLERGNTSSAQRIASLLGRPPRATEAFVPPPYADAVRTQAKMRWLLPALRFSVGLVWIVTGIVSLGLYPVQASYELLARAGTPAWLMPFFLYGAAALDIVLGVLTIAPRRSRWLWMVQAALVLLYTVIISVKIPEFWLHPYGPILKNLPFLAGLWILYELEDRRWNT